MPSKRSAKDRAAGQADYATWKITAGADCGSDEVARAFRDDVARCSDMMSPGGSGASHTAMATRALGVAASCGQDERSRAGTLCRDRGTLERCTDTRLVPGDRHRVEGRLSLA
jgi:hypothetical protein